MVTRAFCTIGTGEAAQGRAMTALHVLDALVDEGEPILSVYRTGEDEPWTLDILFTEDDGPARERWLAEARTLLPELPPLALDPLAERDWVAESQKALHPVRAGRFVVFGSHDRHRLPPSHWHIEIDAGRAFGTAHHASTRGCLLALEALARRRPLGRTVDVGTGTGVLAIAADRLGASCVLAGDVDPVAVRVARENVARNRCHRPVRVVHAVGPFARAQTVVANILARPLVGMAGPLAASAQRTLVLSGLRIRDVRRVTAAYRARGLVLSRRIVIEDWATLIFERRRHAGPTRTAGQTPQRSRTPSSAGTIDASCD